MQKGTKRIYLGGPSAETDLVIADAETLELAGHTITEKWWLRVHEAKSRGFATDAEVPDEYMAESAERNEEGLLFADAIILRMRARPADRGRIGGPSSGLAYELGWIKGVSIGRLAGSPARLVPPVFLVGDPLRFIGIWTWPKPIIVSSIADVLRQIGDGREAWR